MDGDMEKFSLETVGKDRYWSIYYWCSIDDWARSRLVSKQLKKLAEHPEVLQRVFALVGGDPSEKLTPDKYKKLIFKRLRFAHWLDNPNAKGLVADRAFNLNGSDCTPPEGRQGGMSKTLSLQSAGLPHSLLTWGFAADGIGSIYIWNTKSHDLLRIKNGSCGWVAYQLEGEPRVANVTKNCKHNSVTVYVYNPAEGSLIAYQPLEVDGNVSSLHSRIQLHYIYTESNGKEQPSLLLQITIPNAINADGYQVRGTGSDTVVILNADTLKEVNRHKFKLEYGCQFTVHNNQLLKLTKGGKLCPIDLKTGDLEAPVATDVNYMRSVQAGDRSFLILWRRGKPTEVFGRGETNLSKKLRTTPVQGGRWGNHYYLIFWPLFLNINPVTIWRDDGEISTLEDGIDGFFRDSNGKDTLSIREYGNYQTIVPLPDGLAVCTRDTQPTVLRAQPPTDRKLITQIKQKAIEFTQLFWG